MPNKNIKISDLSPADFVSFSQRDLSQEELSMAGGFGSHGYSKGIQIKVKPVNFDGITKALVHKATAKVAILGKVIDQKVAHITSVANKYHC